MRPERFIHSPYRLGPNRHDALGIPYPAVRAMIKPSRRGEMVRFNPELWINLTELAEQGSAAHVARFVAPPVGPGGLPDGCGDSLLFLLFFATKYQQNR